MSGGEAGRQRRRIVEALIESCAEKTFAATTIGDIVSRARVSRTTFYQCFEDKRDCFDAALESCLGELREAASAAQAAGDPPAVAVRMAAEAVLAVLAERPPLAQLLIGETVTVDPSLLERCREATIPAIRRLWAAAGEEPAAGLDPRVAFGQAQLLIFKEIAAGSSERLHALLAEVVYLAVAPFGGHEEALRQSRQATEPAVTAVPV